MRRTVTGFLLVAAVLVTGSVASAQTVFFEDWEAPAFGVGDSVNNNGWSGGGGAAPITIGTTGLGGSQSPTHADCTGTCGSQPTIDLGQTFSSGPLFIQSFVDLTTGGALANITLGYHDAANNLEALVIMGVGGLGSGPHRLLTTGEGGDGPSTDVSALGGFPSGFMEVLMVTDFSAGTVDVSWRDVDDNSGAPTGAWVGPLDFSGVLGANPDARFLRVGFNQNSSGNPPGTQDNIRVFVPEPASLGLVGLGGLLLLGRRRGA